MQELTETPSDANAPAGEHPSHRDLQRAALRDLVALATECATTEDEIERRYKAATESANQEGQRGKFSIQQRWTAAEEQLRQKHQDRLQKADAQFKVDHSALRQADATLRARVDHEHSKVEQEVKEKFDQARWLAESVFESAQNQLRVEQRKLKEHGAAQREALDTMQRDAAGLLQKYRIMPASAPPTRSSSPLPSRPRLHRLSLIIRRRSNTSSPPFAAFPRFSLAQAPFPGSSC